MREPGSPDGGPSPPARSAPADSDPETPSAAGFAGPAAFLDLRFLFSNKRSPAACRSPHALRVEPLGIYGPRLRRARFESATLKAFHDGYTLVGAGRQSSGGSPASALCPRLAFHWAEV